jgi:hypothetical protein
MVAGSTPASPTFVPGYALLVRQADEIIVKETIGNRVEK